MTYEELEKDRDTKEVFCCNSSLVYYVTKK